MEKDLEQKRAEVIGSLYEGYRVKGLLGKGGFATVYDVEYTDAQDPPRPRVAKIYFMDVIKKHYKIEEYNHILVTANREAKALQDLDHPNIVKAYKYMGRKDPKTRSLTKLIIVMEKLTGPTIYDHVSKVGGLKELAVVHYLKGLVSALKYMQSKNYLHRDISPNNIILQRDRAVFIDFGCSKAEFELKTQHTQFIGTQNYIAPEITEENRDRTEKSEVYSLGRTAFFMISGVHPGEVYSKTKREVQNFRVCLEHLVDYSPLIKNFINRATLWNAQDRPTFDQLSKLLDEPCNPIKHNPATVYFEGTTISVDPEEIPVDRPA